MNFLSPVNEFDFEIIYSDDYAIEQKLLVRGTSTIAVNLDF